MGLYSGRFGKCRTSCWPKIGKEIWKIWSTSRILTYGEKVEDRFCITSPQETPFLKRNELDQLIKGLKKSLEGN